MTDWGGLSDRGQVGQSESEGEEYDCEPLEPVADGRYENYHPEGEHSDEEHAEGEEH